MKQLIYILLILLLPLSVSVYAQEENNRKSKLLRELARTPHGTARLEILEELTQATKSQPQVRIYYIDQLLKEAEKQKNDFFKCKAYLFRIYIAYNLYDTKTLHYWFSYLEPLARKNDYYDLLFQGQRCVIDFFQLSGEYEKEESESLAMLKMAKQVNSKIGMATAYIALGHAYMITYRSEEALFAFEQAYNLYAKMDDAAVILEVLNYLIEASHSTKNYAKWLKYIKLEEEWINRTIDDPKRNYSAEGCLFIMYIHYVEYYTITGDMQKAGQYYQLADNSYRASRESGIYEDFYRRIGSIYLQKSGQYDKALLQVDTLITLIRSVSSPIYYNVIGVRAEILYAMGRDEEALHLFKAAKVGSDSVQLKILNKQTEQVEKMHNVYLLQLEKERSYHYRQITILSFLAIAILTTVGFIIYSYRSRRKLKYDEIEMRRMTHEAELANVAKERFLSNISTSISQPLDKVVESSLLLASEQKIEEEQRIDLSEIINTTSSDLMQLINDILDLSRLEAGMMRFSISDVEIFSLMQDAATGASIKHGKKIDISCPESVLFWSNIDGIRLLNVFNNLFYAVLPGKELRVAMEVSEDKTELAIKIYNTLLASHDLSQEQIIRNEINRMIIEFFKGTYENKVDEQIPFVYFTVKGTVMC